MSNTCPCHQRLGAEPHVATCLVQVPDVTWPWLIAAALGAWSEALSDERGAE